MYVPGQVHRICMQIKKTYPYLLILPALLYIGVWILYPIGKTFYLSFFSAPTTHSRDYFFVGLRNYLQMATDKIFWTSLWHNILWVGLSIAIPFMIGLLLAVTLVNRKTRLLYATIYFVPMTVAFIIAAVVWGWIYNPVFGALNRFFEYVGLESLKRGWLGDPNTALLAVNMIGNWGYFGFCTLIILSGLQGVDPVLYDAANIDGAGSVQKFLHVTLPAIRHTLYFLIVYTAIGSMKFFDLIYIATKGGPHHASEIVAVYMFDLFIRQGEINYAASLSVMLTLIIMVLSILMIRFLYEREI